MNLQSHKLLPRWPGWGQSPRAGRQYLLAALLLTAACSEASPRPTPTQTQTATVHPTVTSSSTPTPTLTSLPPTQTPTPSRSLRDLEPEEDLVLVDELPVPRTSFGVRMSFSPTQPILYHTGVGLEIQGYDYQQGQAVFSLRRFSDSPLVMEVSPEGDVVVAADGPALGVWDLATAEQVGAMQMPAMFIPVSGGFVGSGYFYADDEGGNLALWEAAHWEQVERLSYVGRSDGGFVLPDTRAVAMLIRGRREINIVDWSGLPIRTVPLTAEPWRLLSISPLGDQAALHVDVGKGTEGILITDLGEGGVALRIPLLNVRATAMSPDWRTLAVTDGKEVLRLFDPATGAQFYSQPLEAFQVKGLAFSPDGDLLSVHFLRADSTSGWIQIWGRARP